MTGQPTVFDERKHELEQDNPGWQIWYVPKYVDKGAVWCARPLPLLNADSPEELQRLIDQAGSEPTGSL
jgi:folate-dependent phosphoribosylglycinamide formyltransferase PurN